jgi:membrane-associated PAP2 superfamily phosphatase
LQDNFFNFTTHQWVLDRNAEPIKFILYDGIKKLLILFAVLMLFSLVFFRKKELIKEYKKGILVIIFSAILVPVIIGGFKKYTNMPCPKNEIHYGGIYPRVTVWEHYPKYFKPKGSIKCWPAGHASGGFALLSLLFLFKSARAKNRALILAMSVGWSMAIYKMLIGDHFLSHTLITMIMAWLIILIIARLFGFKTVYKNFDKEH